MALSDNTPCTYCGMTGAAGEYHPYGVCLMFKACRNSETVRANLAAMREHFQAEARRDALEEAAKVADSMAPEFGEKGWAAKDRGDLNLSLGMLGVEFQLKTCAQSIRARLGTTPPPGPDVPKPEA